ncbi:tail fiber protein [Escherichia coli]|uniref:Tail fiber protein n=13 Tax=Escherichia coli TaxID=562 RepID=A0A192CJG8_ECO25|nr:tail fiber protein [Escherichia coli]AJO82769.1 phage tail protein [Escherichia coli]ALX56762.1 phage tail protein [Escherichia coli]ANK06328.1 Tail fiber protein [Escherichia coli O25b:H4]AQV58835.1 phage tail protein [Escherichia coli]AQV82210.1 phage tail protein [Escherichia coli]
MSTTTRKFKTVITDTGAKKLAQAAAPDGKPVRLTHMAVGDGGGTLPTPDSKQTRLVHEVWRHTVNRVILDATHQNRIIAELVIPPETGGFWIREIGVFDEHGDLIAVGNTAESYKPAVAEGSGRAQTFRTILTVSSTATVVLTVDNTMVMATVDYVDDKLKEHEQSRRHPDASLTAKGFVQLSSATNSVSETQAATPKAVKAAYDLANGKYTAQDASTTRKGLVQLSSATNSTSETQAATPKAVKAAYDLANAKYTAQDATTAQKGIVQLSSATNSTSETLAATSKAVKAVMDETNKKAPLNSPALTGTPTTPTARQGTNNTQIASTAFVMAAIAALVDSSPDALNTLNELAAALGNDPNFATTMTNALAGKQPKDATLTALAGLTTAAGKFPYFTGNDVASLATLTKVGRDILAKSTVAAVIEYLGLRELGTSGEKIPLLSTANTWTNRQTFSGGLSGELSGNASTAAKLKTARKISNVAFDGSSDITLKASHVGAFALGKTGSTVANDKAVGWNWSSGAYNANIGGASTLIIHFYMGDGSCPAAQFRINYKNGGIFYRSARDGYGFEADWSEFYTTTRKPSAGDVGALPLSGGQLNGALGIGTSSALGGNSIVLGDNDTGFKQNGDGNLDVYANYVHVMRFVPGSIQSNKTINITGRVNPSDYGNFDSRYVKDVRLGSQQYYGVNNWRTWNFQCPSGHVLSGINVQDTGSNSADNIAGVYYRPVQKYINGTWYNVASV